MMCAKSYNQLYPLEITRLMKKIFEYLIELVNIHNMLGMKDQLEKQPLLQGKESMSF